MPIFQIRKQIFENILSERLIQIPNSIQLNMFLSMHFVPGTVVGTERMLWFNMISSMYLLTLFLSISFNFVTSPRSDRTEFTSCALNITCNLG